MNDSSKLYPLRFAPAVQAAPWSGGLLAEFCGAAGDKEDGIRWELLDSSDYSSQVVNGPLAGTSLRDLLARCGQDLVGKRCQKGAVFPLYVRLVDAGKPLPLLVHPDEMMCREETALQPNTKFWYCLAARENASIMVGIRQRVTATQMMQSLGTAGLADVLQTFPALAGDSYLIPSGRVHSASGGVLIWEIGQRPVEPLEVQGGAGETAERSLSWRAIHFEDRQVSRICREAGASVATRRIPLVHHCPFFVVDEIRLVDNLFDRTDGGSFHLFTVVRGRMDLETDAGTEALGVGDVCLVPAQFGGYRCVAKEGPAVILRSRLQSLK